MLSTLIMQILAWPIHHYYKLAVLKQYNIRTYVAFLFWSHLAAWLVLTSQTNTFIKLPATVSKNITQLFSSIFQHVVVFSFLHAHQQLSRVGVVFSLLDLRRKKKRKIYTYVFGGVFFSLQLVRSSPIWHFHHIIHTIVY